jgi:hypothetical protein
MSQSTYLVQAAARRVSKPSSDQFDARPVNPIHRLFILGTTGDARSAKSAGC